MATYIGTVTITIGVRVQARSAEEAQTLATEASFGRISSAHLSRVSERSYAKTAELRLLEV